MNKTPIQSEYPDKSAPKQQPWETLPQYDGRFFAWTNFKRIISSFSKKERYVFVALCIVFILGSLGTLAKVHQMLLIEIPAPGGSLREGVIGTPRFINPLLAISDVGRDLTMLVYSGLLRATPEGDLIPDLAEKYEISEDGLEYTFTLKDGLSWHDGKPVTSDDVVFTITKVQDNALKSPRRASWEGVTVSKIDDRTITFLLKQPYSPFLENTTLGILPSHIWRDVPSEQFGFSLFNIDPIGSGPYRISSIKKDSSGIPKYYDLASFRDYSLGKPYISKIRIYFYANEETLLKNLGDEVETANALHAEKTRELEGRGMRVERYVLPRVFGVFFNQNQRPLFASKTVRKALDLAIDRDALIQEVLSGYAQPLYGPLPPGALGFTKERLEDPAREANTPIEDAHSLLLEAGWEQNEESGLMEHTTKEGTEILQFSISTSDSEELKRVAMYVKEQWEKLGAQIDLKIFNTGDLNQNVIRPRKYDTLFFGEIIGRESDPFAFWHSSQRNDPGLNIALYTNISADSLLEEGRVNFDREERIELYKKFDAEVRGDIPAIFIYSPDFVYIVPSHLKGISTGTIGVPSERFLDVHKWYIETNKVLKFFAD